MLMLLCTAHRLWLNWIDPGYFFSVNINVEYYLFP